MPQVWLTYEEAGRFFGCDADEARTQVSERGLSRRRSRDGLTRVKLDPAAAHEFMMTYATGAGMETATDAMVASLHMVQAADRPIEEAA
jgi:hypothetical protein